MDKTRKHELIAYWVAWAVAFIAPTMAHCIQAALSEDNPDWTAMEHMWLVNSQLFVLFWIHDLLISPRLFKRGQRKSYAVYATMLILAYAIVQFSTSDFRRPPDEGLLPPDVGARAGNPPPRPIPINPESTMRVIIAMMMCGANIGLKFYFRARRDEVANMERERQNLSKELDFLTYQISPHFFMNTLNNIHALIDIDPDKAKNSIIELSRMMRFALYDGRAEAVPLQKEIDFLTHYVALMRLRYTRDVEITTDFCRAPNAAVVPPLIFVTFVENAFKHGISYREHSYIHVKISTCNNRATFTCVNSIHEKKSDSKQGIGLDNVRKRLRLIYGGCFELVINNTGSTFNVLLSIPTTHDNKMHSNG